MKRENYISWDQLFMGIAELASKRSKDPRSQHGACIVNEDKRVVSIGYNGFPGGCSDDEFSWESPEKYDYVIHAEINAILNAPTSDLKGCTMYLYSERGYYPCCQGCSQAIVQKKFKEVVLKFIGESDGMKDSYNGSATKKLFDAGNVKIRVLN